MLVSRVYSVLDSLVVEITCVHRGDPAGSHLVIREERTGRSPSQQAALDALMDVSAVASLLTSAARRGDQRGGVEPCEAAWASPSC